MKRMIACFVTVSIMIGFMQAYAADDSVIVEDFENGMNLFAAVDNANSFSVRDYGTKQLLFFNEEARDEKVVSNKSFAKEFEISFDAIPSGGEYMGVLMGYRDENNYNVLKWNLRHNTLGFYQRINGGDERLISYRDCRLNRDNVNKIVVSVKKNKLLVTWDNMDAPYVVNLDAAVNGKLGFLGQNAIFRIDNVQIKSKAEVVNISGIETLAVEDALVKKVDGSTTKKQFESRRSELPNEIELVSPVSINAETQLFVSPDGSDNNDGSIEKPFQTIKKAIDEAKFKKNINPSGVIIYLRGGTYSLDQTLDIEKGLSGTKEYPTIFSNYQDEKVVITSGVGLKSQDFSQIKDAKMKARLNQAIAKNVRAASLSGFNITNFGSIENRSLYANGEAMTLSRYPNQGQVQMGKIIRGGNKLSMGTMTLDIPSGVEYEMYDTRPLGWKDTGEILFNGAYYVEWDQHKDPVTINKEKRSITSKGQSYYNPAQSSPHITHHYENVFEELDMPGEWYLDTAAQMLYIYPYDQDDYEYLLSYKEFDLINAKNADNLVFNGIQFEGSGKKGLRFDECSGVIIQNCRIRNIAEEGCLFNKCTYSGIMDSYIYNVGVNDGDGVSFGNMVLKDNGWETDYPKLFEQVLKDLKPTHNFIQNNFIATPKGTHRSIALRSEIRTVVSHNTATNCYRYPFYQAQSPESIVEYNESSSSPKVIADAGTIYSVAYAMPLGHHVRYNYFHDPVSAHMGIYFDDMSSDVMAYGNILTNYATSAIFSHGGRDVVAYNNVILKTNGTYRYGAICDSTNYFNPGGSQETVYLTDILARGSQRDQILQTGIPLSEKWLNRFPRYAKYLLDQEKVNLEMERDGENYKRGEAEITARAPSGFYVANNLIIGGGIGVNLSEIGKKSAEGLDSNFFYKDITNPGFYDMNGGDFRIKADAEIYEKIPEFEEIPFERIGIIQENGRWKELPCIEKPKCFLPISDSDEKINPDEVTFMWTSQAVADHFVLTVAEDKNFQNVIGSYVAATNSYTLKHLEKGKRYYWRVEARSYLKSIDHTPKTSEIVSFETMNESEYKKSVKPNVTALEKALDECHRIYNDMSEGTDPGQYQLGTKAAFRKEIKNAEKMMKKAESQEKINKALENLSSSAEEINKHMNPRYVYLKDFGMNYWTVSNVAGIAVNSQNEFIIGNTAGTNIYLTNKSSAADVYCFKLKIDDFKNWMGITPSYNIASGPRYWLIWKPEQIELQFNDSNLQNQTFYKTADISHIDFSDWVDVQLGTVATEKGVWITLKINGETIIDFLDSETPVYKAGNFYININNANGSIHIKETDTVYEGAPKPKNEPDIPDMKAVYINTNQ